MKVIYKKTGKIYEVHSWVCRENGNVRYLLDKDYKKADYVYLKRKNTNLTLKIKANNVVKATLINRIKLLFYK